MLRRYGAVVDDTLASGLDDLPVAKHRTAAAAELFFGARETTAAAADGAGRRKAARIMLKLRLDSEDGLRSADSEDGWMDYAA